MREERDDIPVPQGMWGLLPAAPETSKPTSSLRETWVIHVKE